MEAYSVAPGIVSTVVDGEVTILDPRSGVYFGLEEVGASVWRALEAAPIGVDGLVAVVTREFEVDDATCRPDIETLLRELSDRGLVVCGNG